MESLQQQEREGMTMADQPPTHFCHWELDRFAGNEFKAADGGWLHDVKPPHYENGTPSGPVIVLPGILGPLETQNGADKGTSLTADDSLVISAAWTNEYALQQSIQNAYIEVTKGSIDRATKRGEFVEKAAGTIATAYTAILALTFSVTNFRLPLQGLIPLLFLGLAILLAALYLGYINPRPSQVVTDGAPTLYEVQRIRLVNFMTWALEYAYDRRHLLHMALVSLGAGVLLLPAAYLSRGSPGDVLMWVVAVVALLSVFGLPLGVDHWIDKRSTESNLQ
jgi:hypothetical protein